jgi:DNA-binding transcriptional MerR regulator
MDDLDIGEVRRQTGLSASALHYYEERGLIRPSRRNGLRRRYPRDVLDRLALIRAAQHAGFTLAEAGALLDARSADRDLRTRLESKADELDERIDLLEQVRDQLRHAASCTSPRIIDCKQFQQCVRTLSFGVGSHGRRQPKPSRP